MIRIADRAIVPSEFMAELDMEGAGSVLVHVGVCKADPDGRRSRGITFARCGDAEAELEGIERDVRSRFDVIDLLLAKREGDLAVGDVILFVGVAAKDRENAFGACQEAVKLCKGLKALSKTEHFID